MKHPLFIPPLVLTLSSLTSPQAVNARPQNKSLAERNTPSANTTERNKALVLKWSDALRNKDMAAAQALVTDGWAIHGAGANFARGPEGLKQWQGYIEAMWANPHWSENDIFAEGDKVVRRITVYRTWKSNNKESAMTVVFIYRIADGKIAEVWRVADGLSSYQQIGAQVIMPGTNVDVGQPASPPATPERVAEQKSSSEQKTSQSTKSAGNKNTLEREMPSAGTTESNKTLVARWADAIWNKDLAAAQAVVTNDCVIHAANSTYAKGPEGIKQWLAEADSNWSYGGSTTDDVIAEGDKVARRTTVFAMYKPNHRSTVTPVIFIYRIADGKIAEVWRVANYVSTYLQAGARILTPGETERSVKKTEAEQEVLKAKQEFDEAALRNDADGRASFYADDYAVVYNDGTLGDKAEQLERVRSGRLRYSARTAEDVVVRVYGDTALVIERRKQSATFDGRPRPSDVRASEVWVKPEGKWRLVSTQITPILEPISGPLLQSEAARQPPEPSKSANEPIGTETAPEIANGTSQARQEILKAIQEANEATLRNDADALARIFGDDSLFVIYNGALQLGKESQVESLRSGFMKFSAATLQDVIVRLYGDSAVVIKRRKQVATVAGRTRPGDVRITNVWVKRQGRWQQVFTQVTPILEPPPALTGANNGSAASQAEREVLALEEQMESLQRANSAERTTLWADDLVYIGNDAAVHDKSSLARAVSAGEAKTEFLDVTDRKVRIYGDTAVVTAMQHETASYHGREPRDVVQRYTRVWVRRNAKWQVVSFQATPILQQNSAAPSALSRSRGTPEDEAAIRKIIADGQDAWNRRDAKALAAHISEDHDHINVDGAWRSGRAETEKAVTAFLATKRINNTMSVAKIRFLTPDVAVVVIRNEYSDDQKNWKSISTSVFHKINEIWWNEAFQNTIVQPR